MKNKIKPVLFFFIIYLLVTFSAYAEEDGDLLLKEYQQYQAHFDHIKTYEELLTSDFRIVEEHIFPITLEDYGDVTVYAAIHKTCHRLAIFVIQSDETILYKTEQLSANYQQQGVLEQPNTGVAALSFQDVNDDGKKDLLLITFSAEDSENGADDQRVYKVGDVLFRNDESARQLFYRDYRISDKLNEYGMNKSIQFIRSYLIQGYSTEFLYTAVTLDELKKKGFQVDSDVSRWREFEKWGKLYVASGIYRMAEYNVFMIYLVNEQGYIVWSFQPMQEYESLYALYGVVCQDIDGDGLKDVIVLGRYHDGETEEELLLTTDYAIYYQKTDGFYVDTNLKKEYQVDDSETMVGAVVEAARKYWGWK
ncbi:MAG: VCBS repeat-containing protein [Lachnospiraceae bacterium]